MTHEARIRELVRKVVYRAVGRTPPVGPRGRGLVTEQDLQEVPHGGEFTVPDLALITPLARQTAVDRNIRIVAADGPTGSPARPGPQAVALAADHGGYALKEALARHLAGMGYHVIDCGTHGTEAVDYPDFAFAAARLVAQGTAWRAIVVDGAGIGSCMVANKVPGIRAAMCYDNATAINSRSHNDANVLTLGAGLIGPDLGKQIATTWLATPADAGRHARRVDKIMDIEQRFLRKSRP